MRILLVLLGLALALPASAQGRWQITATNGCYVWNSTPHPGDALTWTGDCIDGKIAGDGTLVWRYSEQGKGREGRYVGHMKAGLFDGHGAMTLADGTHYDGEWRAGAKQGQGKQLFANGDRYDGQWVDGQMDGNGTLHYANGDLYKGGFKDNRLSGQGVYTYANGDRYEGRFRDGEADGTGTYTYANGDRYDGAFANAAFDGKGVLYLQDAEVHGEWREGQLVNQGRCHFKLTGEWRACVQKGDKFMPAS